MEDNKNTPKAYIRRAEINDNASEAERTMVKVYNAARYATVKTAAEKEMSLSRAQLEDEASEAALSALVKTDLGEGSISYASKCGFSRAIKASERKCRDKKRFTSIDRLSGWDGTDEYEARELPFASDDWADKSFREEEEAEENALTARLVRQTLAMLPEKTQTMFLMIAAEKSYEEIAEVLGCSVPAVETRRSNGKKAAKKIMRRLRSQLSE